MAVPAVTPIAANDDNAGAAPAPVVGDPMEIDHDEEQHVLEDEEDDSLCIPITSSAKAVAQGLFVEVFADELAQTPSTTIVQVLRDEKADVSLWADAALVYMQRKCPRDSLSVIEEANQVYTDDKNKKVRLLAANGIAHLAVQQRNQAGAGAGTPTNRAICDVTTECCVFFFCRVSFFLMKLRCSSCLPAQAPRRSGQAGSWGARPQPEPSGRTPTASSRRRARLTRSSP
jgi:hypothetical protein